MKIVKLRNGEDCAILEWDTHISKWVVESGRLDHDQSSLGKILPHIPKGGCVIDVGAYIGDHTIAYANKVGDFGRVIAFEPNPDAFHCLRFNLSREPHVHLLEYGASSSDHGVCLNSNTNGGASWVSEEGVGDQVKCLTIDSVSSGRVDLIKMDCEGFEVRALFGAAQTIERYHPVLVVEVNEGALNRHGETGVRLVSAIKSMGYKVSNIHPNDPMGGPQYDILCLPLSK